VIPVRILFMARDDREDIEIKYAEEALERNAKARIQSINIISIEVAKKIEKINQTKKAL